MATSAWKERLLHSLLEGILVMILPARPRGAALALHLHSHLPMQLQRQLGQAVGVTCRLTAQSGTQKLMLKQHQLAH
jgi:hypothetical protein